MKPVTRSKRWVLGVDGGGTKTTAWIASVDDDQSGRPKLNVQGRGRSGPSNPRSVGFDSAFHNLTLAITDACDQAFVHRNQISIACLSLAGAGRMDEQLRIREWSDAHNIALETMVVDDVEPLAWAAEYEDRMQRSSEDVPSVVWGQSVTLVAGTGSIACGANAEGHRVRVGGWGYLLGDEGSGFWIGMAALRAVCSECDGSGPRTELTSKVLERLGFDDPRQLVGYVYQSTVPRDAIASLTKQVAELATVDEVANAIMESAIKALSELVLTVVQRLALPSHSFGLALSGGVLAHHPSVMVELIDLLFRKGVVAHTSRLVEQPVYGPLLMASSKMSVG